MNNYIIQQNLIKAKKTGDPVKIKKAIIEALRPEAKEAIKLSKKDITTQNGYGAIYRLACNFPKPYNLFFIDACILEGFDYETAQTVKQLF